MDICLLFSVKCIYVYNLCVLGVCVCVCVYCFVEVYVEKCWDKDRVNNILRFI